MPQVVYGQYDMKKAGRACFEIVLQKWQKLFEELFYGLIQCGTP
jgi:hypothetical protein